MEDKEARERVWGIYGEKKDVLRKGDTRETNPPQPDGRYEMRGKR